MAMKNTANTKLKIWVMPILIVVIILIQTLLAYIVGVNILVNFETEAKYESSQVEQNVQVSVNFVNYMSIVAQDHYDSSFEEADELYYELEYDSVNDIYFLNIEGTDETLSDVGYLSGAGEVPVTEEVINELNLAFKFNEYFESFYHNSDNTAWVYYISESGFLNLYPYKNSEMFAYSDDFKTQEYYVNALPENNPEREPVWSSVYLDTGGKGLMVTLSIPIYDGDDFKGVVAVDRTTEDFENLFVSKYDTYLCESDGDIVASNTAVTDGSDDVENINDLTQEQASDLQEVASDSGDELAYINGNFTYIDSIEDTDWVYVSVIPASQLFLVATLKVAPFLILILLFLFVIRYYRKRQQSEKLETEKEVLEAMVSVRTQELRMTQEVTIDSVTMLTEARDNETGNHIVRTKEFCKVLAESLGKREKYKGVITTEKVQEIFVSAPLHDIGKVGIKDCILQKAGKLTDKEREEMKRHTIIGYEALLNATEKLGAESFLNCALDLTRSHHEKWDGSGYPDGLAGEDIPLAARIMAVSDVYDALTSKRVYKQPVSHEQSTEMIISESGTHFDPEVIEAFKMCEADFKKIAEKNSDA